VPRGRGGGFIKAVGVRQPARRQAYQTKNDGRASKTLDGAPMQRFERNFECWLESGNDTPNRQKSNAANS
jgi:hypothetical protein